MLYRRKKRRKPFPRYRPPPLSEGQILDWADGYYRKTGKWPILTCGRIDGTFGETWRKVDSALRLGLRGLRGQSSLARFLFDRRGVRNQKNLPRLTLRQILTWADAHYHRTGQWPKETSGPIVEAPGEKWFAIDRALRAGVRGLSGKSSLAQLLAKRRQVRNIHRLPPLTLKQILAWADAYHARHGAWPTTEQGPIDGVLGETWSGVKAALQQGRRGFLGGSSLARLLAEHRGVRNKKQLPPLSRQHILQWADAYQKARGTWPTRNSGPVDGQDGETWASVDRALQVGHRSLRGGTSLYRLLKQRRPIKKR
jgi:hypothetical protein